MDARTADYDHRHAAALALRYEGTPSPLAPHFAEAFPAGGRVLDVGAGTGRDLAALRAAGYDAWGVEPNPAMRAAAVAAHPGLAGRLVEGVLPDLGRPFGGGFDGLVCSAVLMHLTAPELAAAAQAFRRVLVPGGRLLASVPLARAGIGPDDRDADGRLMTPWTPDALAEVFAGVSWRLLGRWDSGDALGRPDVWWTTLLFGPGADRGRAASAGRRAPDNAA